MKATSEAIGKYLKEQGVDNRILNDTDQVSFVMELEGRQVPVFINVQSGGLTVQLMACIPYKMGPGTVNEVARLLHFLNKAIDAPGFGLDEDSDLIFYRVMIPARDCIIDMALFNNYLNTVQRVCQDFIVPIEPVAMGKVTFDEMKAKAEDDDASPLL